MKILCVGGGSGGHVTPVRAVINELKKRDDTLEAIFVCDKAFEAQSRGLMKHADAPVEIHTVVAGKLRRYHDVSWWRQVLDIPTTVKNIRDIFLVGWGTLQSLRLLIKLKPKVVFAKGGYVCLPVGIAARLLRIPLVIHDSDTRPGLTNRILSHWATRIGTGAPLQNYNYPREISRHVGVPINEAFHPFTAEEQKQAKETLGVTDLHKPLLVVTGGGLGAKTINDAMMEIAPRILKSGVAIYHVTGKKQFDELEKKAPKHADYQLVPFVYKDMATVLGAADIVISRGSATFLQELAALQKAVIVVPAQQLGDQVKNAAVYKEAEAALVVSDKELITRPNTLAEAIELLIDVPADANHLAAQLHMFARPNAAGDVAELILEAVENKQMVGNGHGPLS